MPCRSRLQPFFGLRPAASLHNAEFRIKKTPANQLAAVGRVLARLWCAGDTWKEGV
jgi:hypothetical protein